MYITHYIQ